MHAIPVPATTASQRFREAIRFYARRYPDNIIAKLLKDFSAT